MRNPSEGLRQVAIDGTPAVDWIQAHRRALVDAAMTELRESTVGDDVERAAQLRWILDYNVGLFARVFSGGTALDEEAAAELVASAAVRAGEGFPVENLLETYVGGTAAIWRRLASHARPDELRDLILLTGELFDYLRGVMALVVRGFEREAARVRVGERDARYTAYSALLSGGDLVQAAARSGVPIAARYLVLAIHLGEVGSPAEPGMHVASTRRGNALLHALDEVATGDVLAIVGDPHATALIPVEDRNGDDFTAVRGALGRLAEQLGVTVHVGAAFAAAADVPAAAAVAEEIVQLARAMDLPTGAWLLTDVLLPYQLTRPGPAFDLLRDRLAVLAGHPEWAVTLRVYARTGWDRTTAARELHVHPNTVDYRLRRMAEATGLDAGDPAQRPVVLAALYVLSVANAETSTL